MVASPCLKTFAASLTLLVAGLVATSAAGEISGFILCRRRYGKLLEINWLEGVEEAMRQLAQAGRALAQERCLSEAACFAPDHPPVRQALVAAGFQPEFEMWLYACDLTKSHCESPMTRRRHS